jgi:AcrR family transcriptional regulator
MVFCKRNRKATEQSLLGAAARLFAQKGYENTRTLEIAKEAKVNEALIGRYFGGKEGLLLAILRDEGSSQSLIESEGFQTSADVIPAPSEGLSIRDALMVFFKAGEARVKEREEFMRIALSRSLVDPEMARIVREKLIDRFRLRVLDSLRAYLKKCNLSEEEMEAIAMLVAASNHTLNFLCKRVHHMDQKTVDFSLTILAHSIESYLDSRALGTGFIRSVTTNA